MLSKDTANDWHISARVMEKPVLKTTKNGKQLCNVKFVYGSGDELSEFKVTGWDEYARMLSECHIDDLVYLVVKKMKRAYEWQGKKVSSWNYTVKEMEVRQTVAGINQVVRKAQEAFANDVLEDDVPF